MKIVGEVTSDEELYLDGDLEGKLNLRNRLTVGPNGKINANIKAQDIVVFGTIRGNIESESRISLRAGASIVGDIKTAGIVIEDGAYFKGGIDIARVEPKIGKLESVGTDTVTSRSATECDILEDRYSKLVDKKYLDRLTEPEEIEMQELAVALSALDAGFYEPILQRLQSKEPPALGTELKKR